VQEAGGLRSRSASWRSGPPGKATIAQIVARERGGRLRSSSGPVIARATEIATVFNDLASRDARLRSAACGAARHDRSARSPEGGKAPVGSRLERRFRIPLLRN
jgi:hypothetical protein